MLLLIKYSMIAASLLNLIACHSLSPPTTEQSTIATRVYQSRNFTVNKKILSQAVLEAMQDEGFHPKTVNLDLGIITGESTISYEESKIKRNLAATVATIAVLGPFSIFALPAAFTVDWKKNYSIIIKGSAYLKAIPNGTKLRLHFTRTLVDAAGKTIEVDAKLSSEVYQKAFAKIKKSIFLEKNLIPNAG